MYAHPALSGYHSETIRAQLLRLARTMPIARRIRRECWPFDLHELLGQLLLILEPRLRKPISVQQQGSATTISVLGVVGYRIDHARRVVTGGRVNKRGKYTVEDGLVDLFHPLRKSFWINWMIEDSGLIDLRGVQLDLFREFEPDRVKQHLADVTYRVLRMIPSFRRLRKYAIPKALGLDKELVKIALKSRIFTSKCTLNNDVYTLVWRHESDFRQVHRENHGLLPLLAICLQEAKHDLCLDPVQAIKRRMMYPGVTEAGWDYLARHGTRMFRIPWQWGDTHSKLKIAINYLLALQDAGLPPPPPPCITRTWLSPYLGNGRIAFNRNWSDVPPQVMRMLLIGVDEHRKASEVSEYAEKFHLITEWAADNRVYPDKNQIRSGWRWLWEQYVAWRRDTHIENQYGNTFWDSLIQPFEWETFSVVPITNGADLFREGELMRNCMRHRIPYCAAGEYCVFSVRNPSSGKRLANIGLILHEEESSCGIDDVREFGNQPARSIFWDIAQILEKEIRKKRREAQFLQELRELQEGSRSMIQAKAG